MAKKPIPDWEAFGKAVMENWPLGDVDGFELQELAVKHSVISEVPGGFNPDIHQGCDDYGAEPGDQWFERNYQ